MAVDVKTTGAGFDAGVPQRLFQPPPPPSDFSWDMTADGKRFLHALPQGPPIGSEPINMVLNWPAQLKKN